MKQLFISLVAFIIFAHPVFAEKTMIQITPTKKITTSNPKLTEGDYVEFKIINTDKKLKGLITKYRENSFGGQNAILVIDQFQDPTSQEKYEGTISLSGDEHYFAVEWFFLDYAAFIRGGEVHIRPNKDVFTIWRL